MPPARSFTKLQFWQQARQWSKQIFQHTQTHSFAHDQRLVVQINDSSESVMANIAEGFGRGAQNEFILFLGYALGSLDETQSHLTAAYDRGYLKKEQDAELWNAGIAIRKLTVAFIRSMVLPRGGVRTQGKRPNWSNTVWELYERISGERRPELFEATRPSAPQPRHDEPPE